MLKETLNGGFILCSCRWVYVRQSYTRRVIGKLLVWVMTRQRDRSAVCVITYPSLPLLRWEIKQHWHLESVMLCHTLVFPVVLAWCTLTVHETGCDALTLVFSFYTFYNPDTSKGLEALRIPTVSMHQWLQSCNLSIHSNINAVKEVTYNYHYWLRIWELNLNLSRRESEDKGALVDEQVPWSHSYFYQAIIKSSQLAHKTATGVH